MIVNCCLNAATTYHDFLHGFRAGRSTGTATLQFELLHKVAALREAVFHEILLDLHKAYNALDRSRCLGMLEGYGVGPRALRLLRPYWVRLKMVVRAGGYYGAPFHGERGVTHQNNVLVDALVRHWESLLVAER